MWLFTTVGFFSVVEKSIDGFEGEHPMLAVRARVEGDLEALRERYMPELAETVATPDGDYKFRAAISHEAFSRGLAKLGGDVHYENFKNEVARRQGYERAHAYHDVWAAAMQLNRMKRRER